ncbi:MAG TPA: HD domain-containing protein [Phycisphaerae bacterium]|nr:HD domain-containing protein [Phycisphaerae bacterium]
MAGRSKGRRRVRNNFPDLLQEIEAKCATRLRYYPSELHGLNHLKEVALLAGRIAAEMDEDVEAAMVAGFLHDCARTDDGVGTRHARDSAKLARPVLKECFPHLDAERICCAIERHADGKVTEDPLAGALWDADRLTLPRLGYEVCVELMSTEAGRRMASRQRSERGES